MTTENIYNINDVFEMLDALLREQSRFNWDSFYADRTKNVPFFMNMPDENLVDYFAKNLVRPGKVLELGCGPGRNAIYFAQQGCTVDAIDLSSEAIQWGRERAAEMKVNVNFILFNIFDWAIQEGEYDMIYDSGCFHHIAPHRRLGYLELVNKALKPGGLFAITCFSVGGRLGGSDQTDWEVYRSRSLKGGLGFTEAKLKAYFADYEVVEMRSMREVPQPSAVFGVDALITALFKKRC